MKLYYFVGGPLPGQMDEFRRRLERIGGSPAGWTIYPHASGDGKALHLVEAGSPQEIQDHLQHFSDIYEHSPIMEIIDRG